MEHVETLGFKIGASQKPKEIWGPGEAVKISFNDKTIWTRDMVQWAHYLENIHLKIACRMLLRRVENIAYQEGNYNH